MKPQVFDRNEHVYRNDAFIEWVKDAGILPLMDLAIMTPEAVDTNKQNPIGMLSMQGGLGPINAMESIQIKIPLLRISTITWKS